MRRLLLAGPDNAAGAQAMRVDPALNGLQVGRLSTEVTRVACAVDACLETFERAVAWQADLLFVHHGLFWGRPLALTGTHLARVRLLLEHDLALYAMHLPLDCHAGLGNNAGMADALDLGERAPFGEYRGVAIGLQGRLPAPARLADVTERLFGGDRHCLAVLPFGPERVETVALVSGGGTRDLDAAIDAGVDLFITGDAAHQNYHAALEAGVNVVSGGHYLSEVYGVRAVAEHLARAAGLTTTLIDVATGL
jgi:dinuclear metal center YbgI/SA1388 family protein